MKADVPRRIPRYLTGVLLCGLVLASPAGALARSGEGASPTAGVAAALESLELATGARVRATVSQQSGLVGFLTFTEGFEPVVRSPGGAPAAERAASFLQDFGEVFGVEVGSLAVSRTLEADELGIESVRFRQFHRGVPVTGGELTVHLRGSRVTAVNARTLSALASIGTDPTVDGAVASARALEILSKHFGIDDPVLSPPRLEIFNKGHLGGFEHATRLAWFVEATGPALREFFWVDAETGSVLLHFSQLPNARHRLTYRATETLPGVYAGLPGTLVRSEGEGASGDADADLAHAYAGDTYDYYWSRHGRDSYDGLGSTLVSTVGFCPNSLSCPDYSNAFWNGTQMVYGNGFPAADDVVAHELTHAVTEHTANFFYYMQSGALDESYADIFGETVDLGNGAASDTPADRWFIGEDVPVAGAARNMMDPTLKGDPGKTSDSQFWCLGTDNGGVHTNSGVPNHAYALMVDGGSYNGYSITGIGLTKAAAIQYRALSRYLLSASDFLDNYQALLQACRDLTGTAGVSMSDCTQVQSALDAVEMGHNWPCAPSQPGVPSLCPLGGSATDLFFDDLENPTSGNWRRRVITGAADHWGGGVGDDGLYWAYFPTSGELHFTGWGSSPVAGSSAVEMNTGVVIPAGGALVHFDHSYGFENGITTFWDGGVIEYSADGGVWTDAGSLIVAGARYSGVLSTCCSNPLGGRAAFVADSFGYTATQLDLSSLTGKSVRLRFVVGSDSLGTDFGWFVDDVRVYTCSGAENLWDQSSTLSTWAVASQEFEPSNSSFDSAAADDFVVPAVEAPWEVGGVWVPGHYHGDYLGYTPFVDVRILGDDAGAPGSAVCDFSGLRTGIDFADDRGDFSIRLPTTCTLSAGTYWLSVVADMDFVPRGQWYWTERTTASGSPFLWKNPGDGFGSGATDWTPDMSSATPPNPALGFSLWKATGIPNDLYLSGTSVASTTTYAACNSVTADDFHVVTPGNVGFQAGYLVALGEEFSVDTDCDFRVVLQKPAGCP